MACDECSMMTQSLNEARATIRLLEGVVERRESRDVEVASLTAVVAQNQIAVLQLRVVELEAEIAALKAGNTPD